MIKHIFIDLDDTILDFKKAEAKALSNTLISFDIEPTDEIIKLYSDINQSQWKLLEKGEITRQRLLTRRFELFYEALGLDISSEETQKIYEVKLSQGHFFMPNAEKMLESLYEKYDLYLASNGTAHVQEGRIKSANIERFFKDIFISQRVGAVKPKKEFFDYCFNTIKDFNKENAIIIGDSISSDILGGKNAGIKTCLYNPKRLDVPEGTADFMVFDLLEFENLLNKL